MFKDGEQVRVWVPGQTINVPFIRPPSHVLSGREFWNLPEGLQRTWTAPIQAPDIPDVPLPPVMYQSEAQLLSKKRKRKQKEVEMWKKNLRWRKKVLKTRT